MGLNSSACSTGWSPSHQMQLTCTISDWRSTKFPPSLCFMLASLAHPFLCAQKVGAYETVRAGFLLIDPESSGPGGDEPGDDLQSTRVGAAIGAERPAPIVALRVSL